MTTLDIPFVGSIVSLTRRKTRRYIGQMHEPHFHREQLMMKSLLLAAVMAMNIFPFLLSQVDPISITMHKFHMAMIGATLGSIVCICIKKPADIQEMARQFFGNGFAAVAFGPSATDYLNEYMKWQSKDETVVAISGILGIISLGLLTAVLPIILTTIVSAVPSAIRRALGIPEPADPPKQP